MNEYDVVVLGAGPGGCAAAIAAARRGMRTLLIEKDGYAGGAAVSQSVCVVLSTNAKDFEGIWHEFMAKMLALGGVYREDFVRGYTSIKGIQDPEIIKHAWEGLLLEAGVKLLYHSTVCGAIVENQTVKAVELATKAGKQSVFAKRFIDCTGDGIFAHYAGAQWEQGAHGSKCAMAVTKVMRLGNIAPDAGPQTQEQIEEMKRSWESAVKRGEYKNPIITTGRVLNYIAPGKMLWRMPRHRNELMLVTSRVLNVDPLDPFCLSEAEIEGRRQMWEVADFYKRYVPGCEGCFIAETSSHIGVRSSRRIKGICTATKADALGLVKYPDSIAKSSWNIDVWPPDSYTAPAVDKKSAEAKEHIAKLSAGGYFDIRYGCIVAQGIDNLFMAGRCISAEHEAQASLRIQQTCMSTGQAAGTAAAMSIKDNVPPRLLDTKRLTDALKSDRDKVKPAYISLDASP